MTIFKDDLERVYKLIEKPEAWTQNAPARDMSGVDVASTSDEAVKWCIDGAFTRCGLSSLRSEEALGLKKISTPTFNDDPDRKHAEVLQLLRSAIDRAPVREGVT